MKPVAAIACLGLAAAVLAGCGPNPPPRRLAFGDVGQGKIIAGREACGSCHLISGMQQWDGLVGPPLDAFGRRTVIAGVLPNTTDNLTRWLKSPQAVVPGNAMPDTRLTDQQARDLAAFLESLQ